MDTGSRSPEAGTTPPGLGPAPRKAEPPAWVPNNVDSPQETNSTLPNARVTLTPWQAGSQVSRGIQPLLLRFGHCQVGGAGQGTGGSDRPWARAARGRRGSCVGHNGPRGTQGRARTMCVTAAWARGPGRRIPATPASSSENWGDRLCCLRAANGRGHALAFWKPPTPNPAPHTAGATVSKTRNLPKLQNSSRCANWPVGPRPPGSLPEGPRTGFQPPVPAREDAGLADGGSLGSGTPRSWPRLPGQCLDDIPALGDLAWHLTTHRPTGQP